MEFSILYGMSKTLLIIDDEQDLCKALALYLENQGYIVQVAYSVSKAWKILHKKIPDLIVADIMMPKVDGYEFLRQLRLEEKFTNLPVIFLTAKGLTQDRIKAYQIGCSAYLSKPFDPEELVSIINNLLNKFNSKFFKQNNLDFQEEFLKTSLSSFPFIIKTFKFGIIEFTSKEQYILNLLIQGLMNKEIAKCLHTSIRNIEKYLTRILSKTKTNNRTELVKYIISNNLYI
uniref:Regulatory component of sensory transduction system n=1 Tax=Sciadococcus taiwanensis TaxID=3028030 RepID=A0A9Y1I209_9RHOD|nr:regulatory component of sensory transduction system [Sciadococcus taiwanensis]